MKTLMLSRVGLTLTLLLGGPLAHAAYDVTTLKTEYAVNPLGIDMAQPRHSWRVTSDERGQRQTA